MEKIESKSHDKLSKEFFKSKTFWRPALAVLIGGLAGFVLYLLIGSKSEAYAILSNPYKSVAWGIVFGLFLTFSPCIRGRC
jgi:Na+-transporting NADH:ubiquinone oxidoreductase subunit NqrB